MADCCAQNGGISAKGFMHSLMLLIRGFLRGIYLHDVSGIVLEDFQVSPPSEWNMRLHSTILHTAPLGWELMRTSRERRNCTPFTSLSLHLGLYGPLVLFLTLSLHLCLSLLVSGDLQRAMKSTHVSLTGCSIRAELRTIFIHLRYPQSNPVQPHIHRSFNNYIYPTPGQRTSIPMIPRMVTLQEPENK